MRLNRKNIISGLQDLANESELLAPGWVIKQHKETAIDALQYIRQLEADLRRQGFTEYNTKEEDNDQ